ncbi:protein YIF1B-like isoform X1 [Branchiostoma floridae x Branchiostoma belcheri]
MDIPSGYVRQRKSAEQRRRQPRPDYGGGPTPLFDDTSSPGDPAYNQNQPQGGGAFYGGMAGQQILTDPMANMAMQYGSSLATQGKDVMEKHIDRFISISKLKYYFAVDTTYVGKKLMLLLFPYMHSNWSIRYNKEEPVAPRYEINAPDLYIPVMAFVTYILVAGYCLGTQNSFTPELLGMQASSALVWLILEIVVITMAMYILSVATDIKTFDLLAFCGYKYVGMIGILLGGMLFGSMGYYLALAWCSASMFFFLLRTLRLVILPDASHDMGSSGGNKGRTYLVLAIAVLQPVFMCWLTRHLIPNPN